MSKAQAKQIEAAERELAEVQKRTDRAASVMARFLEKTIDELRARYGAAR